MADKEKRLITNPREAEIERLRKIPRDKRSGEQVARLAALVGEERRERFLKMHVRRVRNARRALRNIMRFANSTSYSMTDDEAQMIVTVLGDDIAEIKRRFVGTPREKGLYDL